MGRIDFHPGSVGVVTFPYTGFIAPVQVEVTPDGTSAVVIDSAGRNVGVIDLHTGCVSFPFTGLGEESEPLHVAIASDGAFALIAVHDDSAHGNDSVHRVDLATNAVTHT